MMTTDSTKTQAKTTTEGQKPFSVDIADPMTFGSDFGMELFTPTELGGIVNMYFRNIFKDYIGCKLAANVNANAYGIDMVSLILYFAPETNNGQGSYVAFSKVGKQENDGVGPRLAAIQQNNAIRKSNMNFTPTKELIDITYPLLDRMALNFAKVKNSPESYLKSGIITETNTRPDYYNTKLMSTVFMETVSIDKLINEKLTGESKKFTYRVVPSPIMDPVKNIMHELYAVQKLDNKALRKKMEQLGLVTKFNDINLITN